MAGMVNTTDLIGQCLLQTSEEVSEKMHVGVLAQLVENKPKQHCNYHNSDNSEDEDDDGYDKDDDDDDGNQSPRLHWTR